MTDKNAYDVIIIGGSYSGLAAGMALGRSLRRVLIIDSGLPCNRQTPYSHNFLTHDGKTPNEIHRLAKQQVEAYTTVEFLNDTATEGTKTANGFKLKVASGKLLQAKKLIFGTGIKDLMPELPGFAECWGITVIHCPYCHGYEVRNQKTGILGNGDLLGYEFPVMISHWTKDLTLYTNGPATLSPEQFVKLKEMRIAIVEAEIEKLEHTNGQIEHILFKNGSKAPVKALYGPRPFEQHCRIPETLGCELTEEGFIKINPMQATTVPGVFACGDNVTRVRTVANAVAMGATAGMMLNREMIFEEADVKPAH
ncbi:MAG: NAD(P)/FAD-dependent oxidoreductase [Bacteroidota bacterium]